MIRDRVQTDLQRGFTLIELLVVLGIIGILIALAIVGLRGAQSGQRDTARKDIAAQINGQLQQWQGAKGSYPTDAVFASTFIGASCTSGSTSGFTVNGICLGFDGLNWTPTGGAGVAEINNNATCATAKGSLSPAFVGSDLYLCYHQGAGVGSAGYILAVYLESASGSYIIAN